MKPAGSLSIAALALALAATTAAQTYKLNAPIAPGNTVGSVRDFRIHPSGVEILFRADVRRRGVLELYRTPLDGSSEPQPVVNLGYGRAVTAYDFSPDGSWLAYLADARTDEVIELFVHQVGTPGSRRASADLPTGGDVSRFFLAPDEAHVLYLADAAQDELQELFSVPLDGSTAPVRMHAPLAANDELSDILVTPSRVVYVLDPASGPPELYSAPLDGSQAAVRLNADLPGGARVLPGSPRVAPGGATVLYLADQLVRNTVELFRVAADGSTAPVRLSAPLLGGGDVTDAEIAVGTGRVVYLARQELYSVPLDGGPALRLNAPLASAEIVSSFEVGPNGAVAYRRAGGGNRLFGVRADGSAGAVELDGPFRAFQSLTFSPDGARVVYGVDSADFLEEPDELRSAPLDGSAAVLRIDPPGGHPGSLDSLVISADSERVLFLWQSASLNDQPQVTSATLDGSSPAVFLGPYSGFLESGELAAVLAVTSDSERALFLRLDSSSSLRLHSAQFDDGSGVVELSGRLAHDLAGYVADFALDGSGAQAVYTSNGMFRVPTSGAEAAIQLPGFTPAVRPVFSPDGQMLVFEGLGGLYAGPADGSAPPVLLADPPVLSFFVVSPDSGHVLFDTYSLGDGEQLWTVPIDGGAPALIHNDRSTIRFPAGSNVVVLGTPDGLLRARVDGSGATVRLDTPALALGNRGFALSADGKESIYATYGAAMALVRVPVDGSAAPLALAAVGEVAGFQFAAGDQWAVYVSRAPSGLRPVELYAVRVDGSSGPVRLNAPLVAGGNVVGLPLLTPDSTRVLYRADQDVDGVIELFSVRVDGSAPPVKLNGPLTSGGGVVDMKVSSDSLRAVYLADQDILGVRELYTVPIDGSAPPLRLNGAMTPGHGVLDFALAPDASAVVYRANQEIDTRNELHLVPLDASQSAIRVIPAFPFPSVYDYAITADSRRVVFRAGTQPELYASHLSLVAPSRHTKRR